MMKQRILEIMAAREGEFISGEELSRVLGISRAGVWKHISALREEGYKIESITRVGHRLDMTQGPLNKIQLNAHLRHSRIGQELVLLKEVSSTNDKAKELARAGAKDGTVVIAEIQKGGRGRRGRSWVSPRGGLWMSVILRPRLELKDAASYTLLAGVAVTKAIRQVTQLQVGIKWPNDILLNGQKVGGILTEVVGEWQAVEFLIIGIGINVNLHADQLPERVGAGSLALEAGKEFSLPSLIPPILNHLEELEGKKLNGALSEVLDEWRRYAACLNCSVVVKEFNSEWPGQSVDIAPDGALIVRNQSGDLVTLYSGEVSLRGSKGDYNFP